MNWPIEIVHARHLARLLTTHPDPADPDAVIPMQNDTIESNATDPTISEAVA
jgi:hypothetical protein